MLIIKYQKEKRIFIIKIYFNNKTTKQTEFSTIESNSINNLSNSSHAFKKEVKIKNVKVMEWLNCFKFCFKVY